uniref:Myrcene synthase, chloroplastic n=1 Tax=Humulus lupulus TaxID=3486 RepID=MTS2_HUMLU|nr:RecName: Full=Myrcene synthase, chloroplastic; AltName: Full=Monoterpene synthase MTS2; Short=HlMTS2; Flags: Precursor [Humulus lupulus]ACI32638.1 MTS2 [Humulus lupulus]
MQCMAVHQFAPLLSLLNCSRISSDFGRLFTPKTSTKSRSSTCHPIQCTVVNNTDRRSANYEPSIWSFDYIQSLTSQYKGKSYSSRLNELKKEVKMMEDGTKECLAQLDLIDTLQRLGISYHFEDEINTILKRKYINIQNNINHNYNLYSTALQFRLLRQHGYLVTQEVFNAFKDETGKFKTYLSDDIMGVLSLYEASFYAMKHENVLEEARVFSTECLKEYMMKMEQNKVLLDHDLDHNDNFNVNHHVLIINHALELPLHWRITRSEARWFIDVYEKKQDMDSTLLEFAKLDFNMVQSTHQEDLKHLSRWWRHSKLGEKLNFARDRLMEAFLWEVGLKFEPEFSYFKRISARLFVLITIIDDIYDVYGTLEELELFTKAVERWDVNAINELPEYMKMPFLVLHNTINEMAFDVLGDQNFLNIEYLKKSLVDLCKCYLQEAKWYYSGYQPTLQEYIEMAWLSIGGPVILVHAYFCFTNPITKESMKFFTEGYPNIIQQSCLIVRLADDFGTFSDELNRGDVPKSIQCYMYDTGASEDEAREHIKFLICETWKDMNKNDEDNSCFSETFVEVCKNLARTALFMYQYGDGHASQNCLSKERIFALIINPINFHERK